MLETTGRSRPSRLSHTQVDLAEKIGIVQTLVTDYERGKLRLNANMILRFATALEVSTDELLQPAGPNREDQIAFTVPNNVPTGCAVPLVVQIGNEIRNNTVLPVANGSRSCTPTNPAFASANVEQAVSAGPVTYREVVIQSLRLPPSTLVPILR